MIFEYTSFILILEWHTDHICVADNPQVRILSRQYKTGCDKSKVRSALFTCAHHI